MDARAGVAELRARQALTQRMGGAEKLAKHRANGKLSVRERIDALLDPGTFHEIGSVSGKGEYDADGRLLDLTPANFIFGRGRIDGRRVVVAGDDFTVRGGSADAKIAGKTEMAEQMAGELRLPLVRLIDATGGSVRTVEAIGRTYIPANPGWEHIVANLSTVPVVSLVLGSVAGIASARAVTAHLNVMVRNSSYMFIAGPPVVARVGTPIGKDELGGTEVHARSGAADVVVDSEAEAFDVARRFLSYLPSSVHELPPRSEPADSADRRDESLLDAVPGDRRKTYRVRDILARVLDRGSFLETGKMFGRSVVTGLARLDGWPVAVMANDPAFYGGAWTAEASRKVTRFVDLAETFHLPVVHFVDCPGFLIGPESEQAGTIRQGSQALAAVYQATVPWCSIILRKAFGVAGAAHCNHTRLRYRYAWPTGDWGSIPLEGGIEAAYKADLAEAADPQAKLAEINARLDGLRSPFRTAEAFGIEEIIDPRDTRPLLCEFADIAAKLRTAGPARVQYRP